TRLGSARAGARGIPARSRHRRARNGSITLILCWVVGGLPHPGRGRARVLLESAYALAGRRNRNLLSVPARRRAMFARCRTTTATAAPAAKMSTGHGSPMSTAITGSEQAATIDAKDA